MDASRKQSIADALQSYRQTVLERNKSSLRILVEELVAQDPRGWSPEATEMNRKVAIADNYLIGDVWDLVSSPRDLLTDDDALTKLCSRFYLDGARRPCQYALIIISIGM